MACVNGYKSKCWLCKNATDKTKCVWVRTLRKKPKGCICDEKGFIVECPKYEELDTQPQKPQVLEKSKRGYYDAVRRYKKEACNTTNTSK